MPPEHCLYRLPPRIFVAVKQHGHEQGRSLSTRNVKERRTLEMPPKVRGWDAKQRVSKPIELAKTRKFSDSNMVRCTMHLHPCPPVQTSSLSRSCFAKSAADA
jgi:hypothetical protein